jgi:3-oxoacyl-ACP reductase-like protein
MMTMETPVETTQEAPAQSNDAPANTPAPVAPSAANSAPASNAGTGAKAAAMVQRLTMIGALPPQPTIIETLTLSQQMPDDVKKQQDLVMSLFTVNGNFEGLADVQNQTFQQIINSNTIQGSGYE